MKEFTSQTGGRYTYIDDILNLQELSLAITSLFDGCDNFIISGCQVSGSSISSGFVFINGKIRYCGGLSNVSSWPVYIYEHNTVERVSYVDAGDQVGRNIYGCSIASSVPSNADVLTGEIPQFIKMSADGSAMRLKDAFFGKYALTIDSAYSSQSVNKNVAFNGNVNVAGYTQSKGGLQILNGNNRGSISYNSEGNLVIQSSATGESPYQLVISNTECKFYAGGKLLASVNSNGFVANVPIYASSANIGSISYSSSDIYNSGNSTDEGAININLKGYNGGEGFYRVTNIGDGKGNIILSINGKGHTCQLNGDSIISSGSSELLQITNSSLSKTDKALESNIVWKDKNGDKIASMGYASNVDFDFYIYNILGSIRIANDTHIAGDLYVKGSNILVSLASKAGMTLELNKKANVSDVYSKVVADDTFVKISDGLGKFVEYAGGGESGRYKVRQSIGAMGLSDLHTATLKSELFKDIVREGLPDSSSDDYVSKLAARQRALCENIGAPYKDDVQLKEKDSGWVKLTSVGTNCELYVRQVGHIVSIQGSVYTMYSGQVFTLPNSIDPPGIQVGVSYNTPTGGWTCRMLTASRECTVYNCNGGQHSFIPFSLTYIV